MQSVNIVDILLPLINLALDPMTVEVSEEMVDVLRRRGVSVPFTDVEGQKGFVGVRSRLCHQSGKVGGQICDEIVVQVFSK